MNLARYLNAINENYILSLDGKWGSGKTIFVKQVKMVLDALNKFKAKSDYSIDQEEAVKNAQGPANAPGLFSDEEIVLDEILSADVDNLTPMTALQLVSRWKKALRGS